MPDHKKLWRDAIKRAVTDEDVRHIMNVMVVHAKAGDINAARMVLEYTIGRPPQSIRLQQDPVTLIRLAFDPRSDDDGGNGKLPAERGTTAFPPGS